MTEIDETAAGLSRFRPYPAYKDSGVEWLGEIPEGWEIRRLKYLVDLINLKSSAPVEDAYYVGLEDIESNTGRLTRKGTKSVTNAEIADNSFEIGDVLFGKLRPYLAKAFVSDFNGICTGELLIMRPKNVLNRFLLYFCLSENFIRTVDSSTFGTKMPRASWDFIGGLPICLPLSLNGQRAIADFLDRETAKIDALIAKKERFIELLEEQRSAVISQAVTKGLDPNAPMKDSGVEWIGEIPAHWQCIHLRHIIRKFVDYRGATPTKSPSGIPLITARNVKNGRLVMEDRQFIPTDLYDQWMVRGLPETGDILFTMEAPLGETAIIEDPYVALAQRLMLMKPNSNLVNNHFLLHFFLSSSGYFETHTRSTGSTAIGIKASHLREIVIPLPPLHEQKEISDSIRAENGTMLLMRSRLDHAISLLREYRTALISAAVTGKIDLRNEVAS